jgi:hypothetical protein
MNFIFCCSRIHPKFFFLLLLFAIAFTPFSTCNAEFEVNYRYATPGHPYRRIIDPEFDDVNLRVLWQSHDNTLYVGSLNPETGQFTKDQQAIASSLADIDAINANGPEWVHGIDYSSPAIIYTVEDADYGYQLKIAKEIDGAWTLENLFEYTDGIERFCSLGTYSKNTGLAGILYMKRITRNDGHVVREYWRDLDEAGSPETLLSPGRGQAHFSFDGTRIAVTQPCCVIDSSCEGEELRNPIIYQMNTGEKECIKQTSFEAGFPWILDPDDDLPYETMVYTLETQDYNRIIVVDQKINNDWEQRKVIFQNPDSLEPYISSPEPFKHNGNWYVVYATSSVPASVFLQVKRATASIWIASLNPADQPGIHQRITPDNSIPDSAARRWEPEAVNLPEGKTVIYYNYSVWDSDDQEFTTNAALRIAEIIEQ